MADRNPRQEQANRLHAEGMALSDAGDTPGALAKYRAALELDLDRPSTLYNVGLIYKYQSSWRESFRFNKRAYELRPDDEATAWNLAIAATALHDWRTARSIWSTLGMKITPGDSPVEDDFGITPVRLNSDSDSEVVWSKRIDPVRARLTSIPYADSGFRYADMVLHDGAPVGYRTYAGQEYAVFNVLQLFEPSRFGTYEADIVAPGPTDVQALERLCSDTGTAMEDWSRSVRILCRACSEGRPHEHHDSDKKEEEWKAERSIALAAVSESQIQRVFDAWSNGDRSVTAWRQTLAATSR
jgi:tetratricopeptide (TPR) repeat protein